MSMPKMKGPTDLDVTLEHAGYVAREEARGAVEAALAQRDRTWCRRAFIGLGAFLFLLLGVGAWSVMARPRYTPRPATRATARCVDGSWSYAVQRQGACSTHGGVKVFYR